MSNKAVSTLKYTGIVTLSQYIKGNKKVIKKINNSGGSVLFDFLFDCLAGNFKLAERNRPTKIMLLQQASDENTADNSTSIFKSVSGFIHLLTIPERVGEVRSGEKTLSSSLCYSFMVPVEYLKNSFDHIGLYPDRADTQEADDYIAICKVDLSSISVASSAVMVVDWELNISNTTDSQNK